MSALCLSLPATLRCAGISRTESIALLVPPAIEAVVSLFLIRAVWRNGRKRWLLVAEAWLFFILAVLDFASHDLVRASPSLSVFAPFDRAVGALSVVPILLYMSFLFLLTRADLLPLITPTSLRTIFQFTIFSLIPPVAMSTELGSLLGVAYRLRQTPSGTVAEIGFNSAYSRTLSLAFTISTLVLLGVFQLLIFFLCTWHISRAWDQPAPLFEIASRPPMSRNRSNSHTSHSYLGDEQGVRGLSWLALALCLGAAETFVAFAPQGFVSTLVRRILRILARGFLLYSLVRGSSDGFSNLEEGTTVMADGAVRAGGIRALISNPRFSTFAQLTPTATAFYDMPRATSGPARPANPTPHRTLSSGSNTSQTRVTVMYDQKSAPVLQMRFSGLDVPDSSKFTTRSIRSASILSRRTSLAGHGGHSTNGATPARSRTLSEKRSGTRLASITIPDSVILAGVTATQSAASSITSLPPLPPQPTRESPPMQSTLQIGSIQRSSTRSSTSVNDSLEGVRDLSVQFPGLPPRVIRRGPTQLAYAVEEESEPPSSRQHSREHIRTHARTDTEDSVASALSSSSRRKPVPPHTPRGTIIVPNDQERRPSIPKTDSGEEVVVEAHSALFPETADPMVDYAPGSPQSSARSSFMSDLTSTVIATASPEQLRKPGRPAERIEVSEAMRREVERNWMRRSRPDIIIPPQASQNIVISRTPEISAVGDDYMSARVELEGNVSPRSPWSAAVPYAPMHPPSPDPGRSTLAFPRVGTPSRVATPTRTTPPSLPGTPPRATLGLPPNPRAGRPGSNVEGWGRKLSGSQEETPTLSGLAAEEKARGETSERWQESEVLGRYEGEFVRRSMASYRPPSTSSDPFAGDGPHAI